VVVYGRRELGQHGGRCPVCRRRWLVYCSSRFSWMEIQSFPNPPSRDPDSDVYRRVLFFFTRTAAPVSVYISISGPPSESPGNTAIQPDLVQNCHFHILMFHVPFPVHGRSRRESYPAIPTSCILPIRNPRSRSPRSNQTTLPTCIRSERDVHIISFFVLKLHHIE